ncbi:hypothetical protein PBAT_00505 [Paenibacillus antarcticus]|uniref:Uncharacterized protein n=1 Tax=Paenibacillus antarcticus TaxID=253703 RepID=A0A168QSQ3_9BACL|nr:hypothetical protein PBAT_00505 [Paenibacillus antarcticus]
MNQLNFHFNMITPFQKYKKVCRFFSPKDCASIYIWSTKKDTGIPMPLGLVPASISPTRLADGFGYAQVTLFVE